MIVLSYVDLPRQGWQAFLRAHPKVRLIEARTPADLEEIKDEPEVVFGNVPVGWVLRMAARGRLRWMQSVSAGTESYEVLLDAGVRLTSMRGVHHSAMAQHVLAMMLALTRAIPQHIRAQLEHDWSRQPDAITPLNGSRVGVIGYGGIGRALARVLEPFDVRITGLREQIRAPDERGTCIWPMERLDDLLATSDHIVLCLPLLDKYRKLIDAQRIALFTPGAFFYNIGRGALVDQQALLLALQRGRLAGAALDVFEEEPLPRDSTIWDTPNLIITPHIAGHDRTLRTRCQERFLRNFELYCLGLPLETEVAADGI